MPLHFDPKDPFPLWVPLLVTAQGQINYANAQTHSAEVDRWLGLEIEETEARIRAAYQRTPEHEAWLDLPAKSLLTPYTELREIVEKARLA